jgi:hypothetical protein
MGCFSLMGCYALAGAALTGASAASSARAQQQQTASQEQAAKERSEIAARSKADKADRDRLPADFPVLPDGGSTCLQTDDEDLCACERARWVYFTSHAIPPSGADAVADSRREITKCRREEAERTRQQNDNAEEASRRATAEAQREKEHQKQEVADAQLKLADEELSLEEERQNLEEEKARLHAKPSARSSIFPPEKSQVVQHSSEPPTSPVIKDPSQETPTPEPFQSNEYITRRGYLASPDEELLEQAMGYIIDNDEGALEKLMKSGLVIMLKPGLRVLVTDFHMFNGTRKIRPRGQILEVWVPKEALSK